MAEFEKRLACVIAADGRKIMFHNGDGFGKSGVGVAVLDAAG